MKKLLMMCVLAVFMLFCCDEQPKTTILPIGGCTSQMSYVDMTGVQVYHYPSGGTTFYPVDLSSGAVNTVVDSTVIFVHSPSRIVAYSGRNLPVIPE